MIFALSLLASPRGERDRLASLKTAVLVLLVASNGETLKCLREELP
jgi:hypothetical protein